jgi:hypothetical protein
MTNYQCNYLTNRTEHRSHSVETLLTLGWCSVVIQLMLIFKIGQRACDFLVLPSWPPVVCLWITMTQSLINYLTYKPKDGRRSVDMDCYNRAESVSLPVLPIEATYLSFMIACNHSPCSLTMMQGQTVLTLHWGTFSEWGREHFTVSFGCKCGL